MSEVLTGKVKFFNKDKGFGFIEAEGGDMFFHITKIIGTVEKDDYVTFEVEQGKKGLNGVNVRKRD